MVTYMIHDDFVSLPMALAIIRAADLYDSVVHVEYSNHLGFTDSASEWEMNFSARGGALRFGYPPSLFYSAIDSVDATSDHLAAAINASSAGSPLWILAGGPMETIWRGINKATPAKRKYVRVVSHSQWNEQHVHFGGPPLSNDWEDLVNDFTLDSTQFIQIPDQNNDQGAGFKARKATGVG
ncbi:MAG: hypothetical protein U5L96_21645 [Owenweeksia sp.]|nr:hypothetical protein [Owenweeksia sp.]